MTHPENTTPANPAQGASGLADRLQSAIDGLGRHGVLGIAPVMREAVEFIRSAAIATAPKPPGWPDPLESPQAEAIRNGKLDDTEIRNLFDCMERELRLHRERAANPAQGVSDGMVEAACAAYAKATGYYVDFHPGLKSESAAKMRAGMRAALTAAIGAGVATGPISETTPVLPTWGGQAVAPDWQRIDDALVSCAGLLRTLCKDEIGDTAAAELEYVRSALSNPPAQPGWRNMSSAPKDGTKIQVWADGYEWPEIIYYERYDDATAAEAGTDGYWRYADDLFADVAEVEVDTLNCWQPIPVAPLPGGA